MSRRLTSLSMLGLAVALGGCVVDDGGEPAAEGQGEAIESVESALGEVTCSTQSCTAANFCSSLALPTPRSCSYTYSSFTTPSRTYGSASCPKQHTIKVTGPTTTTFLPYVEWGDTPLTQANCAFATVTLTMFETTATTFGLFTSPYHGVWTGGIINSCDFVLDKGWFNPHTTNLSGRTVKLSGAASLFGSPRKVTIGMRAGRGPC